MNNPITTEEGYLRLQKRLQAALDSYYAICATNAEAAGAGDNAVWHDNFAYEQNQRDMHKWAYRINELREHLAKIRVIPAPQTPTKVQVGCVVTLRDELENKQWSFEVAGYEDGDIQENRVSYTSPLMQEIIGGIEKEKYELLLDDKVRNVIISSIKKA